MKKRHLVIVVVVFLTSILSIAWAEPVVQQLFYQKKTTLAPKTYTLKFTLWDVESGGTAPVWEEEEKVTLSSSTIKTYLGDTFSLDGVDFSKQLWIQVEQKKKKGKYALVVPRERFGIVPYAIYSEVSGGGGDGSSLTGVTAGFGLTGGGTFGNVILNVDFAGGGAAQTVSRSDHGHFSENWTGNSASPGLEVYNTGTGNGIRGYTYSTSTDNAGVHGTNTSTGSGVYGEGNGGPGVRGLSYTGDGVRGESSGSNKSGVYGVNNQSDGYGVYGRNTGGGPAVYSNGDLYVTGRYKGGIGPKGGAPFPRPAYDSGWVNIPGNTEMLMDTGLPPPTYSNDNFFIYLRGKVNNLEFVPFANLQAEIESDNKIEVYNSSGACQFRLQVWYIN